MIPASLTHRALTRCGSFDEKRFTEPHLRHSSFQMLIYCLRFGHLSVVRSFFQVTDHMRFGFLWRMKSIRFVFLKRNKKRSGQAREHSRERWSSTAKLSDIIQQDSSIESQDKENRVRTFCWGIPFLIFCLVAGYLNTCKIQLMHKNFILPQVIACRPWWVKTIRLNIPSGGVLFLSDFISLENWLPEEGTKGKTEFIKRTWKVICTIIFGRNAPSKRSSSSSPTASILTCLCVRFCVFHQSTDGWNLPTIGCVWSRTIH